ncbi:hypothetical protein TNCV_4819421 [Trichonephila clavipes]|nr:hypothetical protein TNCV_4819421 [Trichonephila clavipes]
MCPNSIIAYLQFACQSLTAAKYLPFIKSNLGDPKPLQKGSNALCYTTARNVVSRIWTLFQESSDKYPEDQLQGTLEATTNQDD